MPERRSVGRRFIDLRPDAPTPLYPIELERRRCVRRDGDRPPTDGRKSGRRNTLLFCASWRCAWCGRELKKQRNVPQGSRRLVVVEAPDQLLCDCHEARLLGEVTQLEWRFQSGTES